MVLCKDTKIVITLNMGYYFSKMGNIVRVMEVKNMAKGKRRTYGNITPGAHPEGWGQDTEFAELYEAIKNDSESSTAPEETLEK